MGQGLILAIGGVLTIMLNGLADGGFEWRIHWFTRRLLALATERLPETQQERFAEEWTSHMNDVRGDVRKIVFAWGCVCAAHEMAASLRVDKETIYGRVTNGVRGLLRALKRFFLTTPLPWSGLPQFKVMHVKVGPTRPDGKPHPHAGKTGRITRYINTHSDPYWLGPASVMVELDFPMVGFIWVSLASLEFLPEIILTPESIQELHRLRSRYEALGGSHTLQVHW